MSDETRSAPSPLAGEGREGGRAREGASSAGALNPSRPPPPAPSPQGGGEVSYRCVLVRDAPALAAFAARTFTETFGHLYPPEDLAAFLAAKYGADIQAREIADPETTYALAMRGDAIVGYCQLGAYELPIACEGRPLEIHRLYVDGSVKGVGVARALMDDALAQARARGADSLWLSVWENNERAQRFYKSYGFEDMGEHKFMVGRVADRDLLWRLAL